MANPDSNAGIQFENQVRLAFRRIGLKDIAGGQDFRVGGHQIDACGGWDDVLLVVECMQSTTGTGSVHETISEVRGKQPAVRRGFKSDERYKNYSRFEFAIITRNIKHTEGDRSIALERPKVHLIDFHTLEYYQRLTRLVGEKAALFNFLGELEIEPRDFDLPRAPAFKVQFGKGLVAYLFWCEPHVLLRVAYVARRESGRGDYYQRMLAQQRLNSIKDFIQHGGIFPNNIIVTFDGRPQFRPKQPNDATWPSWLEFGELVFPKSYRSCWVIDGQHRLYAFGRVMPNTSTQKLAVVAFENLSEPRQAKFFIEINKEQKPISPDLIWDLEGEMSPDTLRGQIARCVKTLNGRPPLKDKIFLPLSGKRLRGQLKMSGICQDIYDIGLVRDKTRSMTQAHRNPLVHRVDLNAVPDKVAIAISGFMAQIQAVSPEYVWSGLLLRPGGITLALNVYEQVIIKIGREPSTDDLSKYAGAMVDVLTELVPKKTDVPKLVREQLTSYAQRRQLTAEVVAKMQERLSDREFGKTSINVPEPLSERLARFERRLAEFVCEHIEVQTVDGLKQKAPEAVWRMAAERFERRNNISPGTNLHELLTLGQIKEILERSDNKRILMPLFLDAANGFGEELAVLVGLAGIIQMRNALDHGRRTGNRRLNMAYLETFESLIG